MMRCGRVMGLWGYGVITRFGVMNIHLPAILGVYQGTRVFTHSQMKNVHFQASMH